MNAINCKKFPMIALAACEVAGVKYAPGQEFCVETDDSRQFLIAHNAAKDYPAANEAADSCPAPTELAQPIEQKVQHASTGKATKRLSRNRGEPVRERDQ